MADLQRQYAYDQLVERLYRTDEGWVVKGATALLARRLSARHTIDIDLYRAGKIDDVEAQLREAARLDIGDWMRFEVGTSVRIKAAGAQGARVKIQSLIGTRVWAGFQVDIVADGIQMSAEPEPVRPLTSVSAVAQERRPWRAYPLVDHVADKVCAILERHGGRPSTRFKDLIDLVTIVEGATVSAESQMRALSKESRRRKLELPPLFDPPDRKLWTSGYRAEAGRAVGLSARELDDALAVVRPFLNPLLAGSAVGTWSTDHQAWLPTA
ncbi:nucleotidyl transferase AbiEii/AbiGii toxin family protein [Paractinoplanes deccanensis]|uniref:nucleotidyl transferase AbiEii/AbiGii toxin family protein n=1 Tax=Paractinoplanes deccanensis TaxID=113561 RepID=UPI001940B57D|nr:nucleotidyl transferase AbiEii/AbiGii toxin family protein [Actinoplanes deccanensis]